MILVSISGAPYGHVMSDYVVVVVKTDESYVVIYNI
jgi:hypothetical protein